MKQIVFFLFSCLSCQLVAQEVYVEMFPVVSPDGTKIAFLSDRDKSKKGLKLYSCNADGTDLTMVTKDSNSVFRATWFPDGEKLLITRREGRYYQLATIQKDGNNLKILTNNTNYHNNSAALSRDGKYAAYESNRDGNAEIYIMNLATGEESRLTHHDSADTAPSWSNDGKKLVFHSKRNGNNEIYVINADGSGLVNLTNHLSSDTDPVWSMDGRRISFNSSRDGNSEIYSMDTQGGDLINLSHHSKFDYWGNWFPGEKRLVFHSGRNGPLRLFTVKSDGTELKQLLQ